MSLTRIVPVFILSTPVPVAVKVSFEESTETRLLLTASLVTIIVLSERILFWLSGVLSFFYNQQLQGQEPRCRE